MKWIVAGLSGGTSDDRLIIESLTEEGKTQDIISVQTDDERVFVGKVEVGDEHMKVSQKGLERLIRLGHSPNAVLRDAISASFFRTKE